MSKSKIRLFAACVLLTFGSAISHAQTLKQYIEAADKALENENYKFALDNYRIALDIDSTRTEFLLGAANAAKGMLGYTSSAQYYKKYIEQGEADTTIDTRAYFWYGLTLMNQGLYDSASQQLRYYLTTIDSNEVFYGEKARLSLESCDFADLLLENPLKIRIDTSISDEVNTPQSDFAPHVHDGLLYYSSMDFEPENPDPKVAWNISKILTYDSKEGKSLLSTKVNHLDLLTQHACLSNDGSRMYFTICNYVTGAEIQCDIYTSKKDKSGEWSERLKLPDNINASGSTSTHPAIMKNPYDGKHYLLFVSDRKGGKGRLDIWMSEILGDNLYGTPKNLEDINTFDDDVTPFYHSDSNKLYFSTKGRKGLGEFDIYQARFTGSEWKDISNIGYPINGPTNDWYPFIMDGGREGYFSSNRPGSKIFYEEEEACCYDIYRFIAVSKSRTIYLTTLMNTPLEFTADPMDKNNNVIVQMEKAIYGRTAQNPDSLLQFIYVPEKDYIGRDKLVIGLCSDEGLSFCDTINYIIDVRPIPIDTHYFVTKEFTKLSDCVPLIGFSGSDSLVVTPCDDGLSNGSIEYAVLGDKLCFEYLPDYGFIGTDEMCLEICNTDPKDNCVRKVLIFKVIEEDLEAQLPVVLYFDNDIPKPDISNIQSSMNYIDLHKEYITQKKLFIDKYTSLLDEDERELSVTEMNSFFDNVVGACDDDMKRFSNTLVKMLGKNDSIEIRVQGFTSPRADDDYNIQLSRRRISTIINYLKEFENKDLADAINEGRLIIVEEPIGEAQAPDYVSDKINDPRKSIFSIEASVERRVEIVEVNRRN